MIGADWLDRYAPGLQALSAEERDTITYFSFLWTMFEARVLDTRANAGAIVNAAERWAEDDHITAGAFQNALAYFRDRYVEDGEFTYHFDQLHLRRNDAPVLVKKVLLGKDETPQEIAAAVLVIVYRYRNNLFHGVKWSYELQGQLENFTHANAILMQAIELHEKIANPA